MPLSANLKITAHRADTVPRMSSCISKDDYIRHSGLPKTSRVGHKPLRQTALSPHRLGGLGRNACVWLVHAADLERCEKRCCPSRLMHEKDVFFPIFGHISLASFASFLHVCIIKESAFRARTYKSTPHRTGLGESTDAIRRAYRNTTSPTTSLLGNRDRPCQIKAGRSRSPCEREVNIRVFGP